MPPYQADLVRDIQTFLENSLALVTAHDDFLLAGYAVPFLDIVLLCLNDN